jgi:hypothetical protein
VQGYVLEHQFQKSDEICVEDQTMSAADMIMLIQRSRQRQKTRFYAVQKPPLPHIGSAVCLSLYCGDLLHRFENAKQSVEVPQE